MRRALCVLLALLALLLSACGGTKTAAEESGIVGRMELKYAEHFSVDYYDTGAARLQIGQDQSFLLLPEGAAVPAGLETLPRLPIPVSQIYLASSSAPDLFLQMGALDTVLYSSTTPENWRIPELREEETIYYAGKYSDPDYELLLSEGCGLVVENTMILHSPAVKEKLEELGLPVMIEYSSYEPHPLGRVEWIKLYGLLTGRLPAAEEFFDRQLAVFQGAENAEGGGQTVAFFHLTPNGGVVVRRSADYVTRLTELAGGRTAFTDLPEEDNALSTTTIQLESFYTQAREADVLIYNSTVTGDVETMADFLALSPVLKDFKAVRENRVWCTEQSMFQRSSAAADMIADIRAVLDGTEEDLHYLHRIE